MSGSLPYLMNAASISLAAMSGVLLTMVDVLKHYGSAFPSVPFVYLAWLSMFLSPLLATYSAVVTLQGFKLWQPFQGGTVFVTLQSIGWFVWVMCNIFSAIAMSKLSTLSSIGGLITLGVFGFGANLVVYVSFNHFIPPSYSSHLSPHKNPFDNRVIYALCGASTLVLVLADVFPMINMITSLVPYAMAAYVVSSCLVHIFYGWYHLEGYRLWQPFQGGFKFVTLQMLGWITFALTLYAFVGLRSYNIRGSVSLLGVLGFISQRLLLLSLQFYVPGTNEAISETLPSGELLACSVIAAVHTCIFLGLEVTIWTETFALGRFAIAVPATALLYATTPMTHVLGLRLHRDYRLWQPFYGGSSFVQLQALGWFAYATSLFFMCLYLAHGLVWPHVWIVATTAFLSQVTVLVSLKLYRPALLLTPRSRSANSQFLNGEWLVSAFLMSFAVVMLVTADTLRQDLTVATGLVMTAALFSLIATPLAHYSGRLYIRNIFTPFQGKPEFIALQSLGWMLYAIEIILITLTLLNVDRILHEMAFRGLFWANAILGFVSWALIVCSLKVEESELTSVGSSTGPFSANVFVSAPEPSVNLLEAIEELKTLTKSAKLHSIKSLLRDITNQLESQIQVDIVGSSPRRSHLKTIKRRKFVWNASVFASMVLYLSADLCGLSSVLSPLAPSMVVFGFVAGSIACMGLHVFTGPELYPGEYKMWQPFRGGPKFLALQTVGWGLFGASFVFSFVCAFWDAQMWGALHGFVTFCGIIGVFAYVVLNMSLSTFDTSSSDITVWERHAEGLLSGILMLIVFLFLFVVDATVHLANGILLSTPLIILASVASCAALPLGYYAIINSTKKWREERRKDLTEFDEDVPLSYTEATGWFFVTVFCSGLIISGYQLYNRFEIPRSWLNAALGGMLIAYVIMAMTVISRTAEKFFPPAALRVRDTCFTFTVYMSPAITTFIGYGLPMLFPCPAMYVVGYNMVLLSLAGEFGRIVTLCLNCIGAVYTLYDAFFHGNVNSLAPLLMIAFWLRYAHTYLNKPSVSGCRRWEQGIQFFSNHVSQYIAGYFSFNLIFVDNSIKNDKQYIFAYHPHGVFPFTIIWGVISQRWRRALPTMRMSVHSASIVFNVPMIRDLMMWLGGREVTRLGLDTAVQKGDSVVLCPGGQREMLESSSGSDKLCLTTKHKGFVKFALEHGVPLVPMVCFGETQVMDIVPMTRLQNWFLKKVGFGYPLVPFGRWFLPLPRCVPLTLVIGSPFPLPKITHPTPDQVDLYHKQYYEAVRELVHNVRQRTPYPNTECILKQT